MFGSVGGAVHDLTAADTVLRSSLPLSRRIAVVAVDGGAGTTAVATALSGLLAHRRSGPVLGVDAAGGQHGLVARSGIDPSPATGDSPPGDPTERAGAGTLAQATAGLPRSTTGGYLLDLAGDQRRSASVADWSRKVSPIARFFDLVITDWGVRPVTVDLPAAVQTSHVVVMVGRADRRSATTAASALAGLPGVRDSARDPAGAGRRRTNRRPGRRPAGPRAGASGCRSSRTTRAGPPAPARQAAGSERAPAARTSTSR